MTSLSRKLLNMTSCQGPLPTTPSPHADILEPGWERQARPPLPPAQLHQPGGWHSPARRPDTQPACWKCPTSREHTQGFLVHGGIAFLSRARSTLQTGGGRCHFPVPQGHGYAHRAPEMGLLSAERRWHSHHNPSTTSALHAAAPSLPSPPPTTAAWLHSSTSQQAHEQGHQTLCGAPQAPRRQDRGIPGKPSHKTPPQHKTAATASLPKPIHLPSPGRLPWPPKNRAYRREVVFHPGQLLETDTGQRSREKQVSPICHTSVLWRGAPGPWELPPAGKSREGGKNQSQLGRRATKPAWSRQPPHIREDSSQKHPQAVPLLPRQSPVSTRRDDTPLPGASQPIGSQSQARRAALRAATRSQRRVTPLGKGPASSVQTRPVTHPPRSEKLVFAVRHTPPDPSQPPTCASCPAPPPPLSHWAGRGAGSHQWRSSGRSGRPSQNRPAQAPGERKTWLLRTARRLPPGQGGNWFSIFIHSEAIHLPPRPKPLIFGPGSASAAAKAARDEGRTTRGGDSAVAKAL